MDLVHITGFQDADASYLALNPLGKIPTYVDQDGFVLTECIRILTYGKASLLPQSFGMHHDPCLVHVTWVMTLTFSWNLVAMRYRHKRNLLGANEQEYFKIQQWMSFANSEFLPAMGGVLFPIMKGKFPMQIHSNAEDSARMMLKELKMLDDHLSGREYLVGESLTIADLLMVSFVGRGFQIFHGSWYSDYPNISRWLLPIYNMPDNIAVMGELQKFELEIPEALRGMEYQAAEKTREARVAARRSAQTKAVDAVASQRFSNVLSLLRRSLPSMVNIWTTS